MNELTTQEIVILIGIVLATILWVGCVFKIWIKVFNLSTTSEAELAKPIVKATVSLTFNGKRLIVTVPEGYKYASMTFATGGLVFDLNNTSGPYTINQELSRICLARKKDMEILSACMDKTTPYKPKKVDVVVMNDSFFIPWEQIIDSDG